MTEAIPFSDLRKELSNWKATFESFITNKTQSLPAEILTAGGNDLSVLFQNTVMSGSDASDLAKKLAFQINKNLLVAADIYSLKQKKDEYLPDYLTDEFEVTCKNIGKLIDELEQAS
jgi:hypothetical protein